MAALTPHATIIVGARTQYVVKVDWEDYDFLMQWKWTFAVSHPRHGGLVYARRSIREGGRRALLRLWQSGRIERCDTAMKNGARQARYRRRVMVG